MGRQRLAHLREHVDERLWLIFIGAVVGVFSGLASVLLTRALSGGAALLSGMRGHWLSFLLPAAGAGLSALLLRSVFREAGGHGVPEVIYAISRRGGLLRLRSAFSRLASSLLTIASGGSAGPEAPVVISGASIGSNISNLFNVNDRQRYVIVGCGGAGAIAAIFNAPMAGIAFSLEAILGEWTPVHLVPIAVASVAATEVSRLLQGNQVPFAHLAVQTGVVELFQALGLSLLCAAGAVALVRCLRRVEKSSAAGIQRPLLRAAAGGLMVGLLALLIPLVSGEGYEIVRTAIGGRLSSGLWIIGLAALAKILATALTIGTGGSGGLFAPCLVVGSLTGVFFHRVLISIGLSSGVGAESLFALLGMCGLLSGVLQAPLTGILLILEITGSYNLVLPVVLVSVVTSSISHRFEPYSVYHQELAARGELLRPRTDARVLADLSLMEVVEERGIVLHPDMTLKQVVDLILRTRQRCFPVVEESHHRYLGLIDVDEARPYLFNQDLQETVLADQVMNTSIVPVEPDAEVLDIMERFTAEDVSCLPVVQGGRLIGLISKLRILEHYRRELMVQEDG